MVIFIVLIFVAVSVYRLVTPELQRVVGQVWRLLLCLLGQATC
jgi:hypothetical protein